MAHLKAKEPPRSGYCLRGYARVLKKYFATLEGEDFIKENPATALPIPKAPKKVIATFTDNQLKRLLAQPNRKSYPGLTHYTIMLTLLDTGIRLTELITLQESKVHVTEGFLIVIGKGDKERAVPIGKKLASSLSRYQIGRPESLDGCFFVTSRGKGYSKRSIQDFVTACGKRASVKGVRVSPHTFRHTFAKKYLLNGGDAFTLQKILGHTSMDIVRNYVNMAQDDIVAQHKRFSPVDRL